MDQSPDPIKQELPDFYPSCAATRAMAKKAILTENQSDVDLTDSFIDQSFKNEITTSPDLAQDSICFYIKQNGILMRKWRSPEVPADD